MEISGRMTNVAKTFCNSDNCLFTRKICRLAMAPNPTGTYTFAFRSNGGAPTCLIWCSPFVNATSTSSNIQLLPECRSVGGHHAKSPNKKYYKKTMKPKVTKHFIQIYHLIVIRAVPNLNACGRLSRRSGLFALGLCTGRQFG